MKKLALFSAVLVMAVITNACGGGDAASDSGELSSCNESAPALEHGAPAQPVSFRNDVAPIFAASCSFVSCHGARARPPYLPRDASQARAELVDRSSKQRASTRWVVPNKPEESWLLAKLTGDLCAPECSGGACGARMPKGGDPLPPEQISVIERWIAQGAKDD